MNRFLDWFNKEENIDPVIKASITHLWFVTIHPFDDGNGRIKVFIPYLLKMGADTILVSIRPIAPKCCFPAKYSKILARIAKNWRNNDSFGGILTIAPKNDYLWRDNII